MKRKAFTLIELLVVIAIIAILAAILFPVFAQAKAAAKSTASLSNTKELALAAIMYSGDADDMLPLDVVWYGTGSTAGAQLCYGATGCFAQWSWLVQPYVKNSGILFDPLAPHDARGVAAFDDYYVQYGYNYTFLSPDEDPSGPGHMQARSQTSFPRPAETLMLAAKWANSENTSGYDYGTDIPGGGLLAGGINPVDCGDIIEWCEDSWGVGSTTDTAMHLSPAAGAYTGGASLRVANQITAAWLDGHSKKIAPGALAIGTTWAPGVTNTNVHENSNYLTANLWGDQ